MGIPSYYSYLIKNHPTILEIFLKAPKPDHFYLDANSIIYDVVNRTVDNVEIINQVIQEIENYVLLISPKQTVTIAFDGCAPRAKMQQQRDRRFKTYYLNKARARILKEEPRKWDTANITPGTEFMKLLSTSMKAHFTDYNVLTDCSGEGEHKIFEIIRNATLDETHVIYGLDSDLIMISMMHIELANIFLFRETPQYIKQFHSSFDPTANYLLNVSALSKIIEDEMGGSIHDYVFISLLMGNDFMPHFPALNIRTGGIVKIIDAYRLLKAQMIHVDRKTNQITIYWNHFFQFIRLLSEREEEFIQTEFLSRSRKRVSNLEKFQKIELLPSIDRATELFINPFKKGWEARYYSALGKPNEYVNGLIWNITYYSFGCPDWNWHYPHHYPPLLKDLVLQISREKQTINYAKVENKNTDLEQLCMVLPKNALYLVPEEIRKQLDPAWYVDDCCFTWAFCKYFWESHPDLPEIDIDKLKKICK